MVRNIGPRCNNFFRRHNNATTLPLHIRLLVSVLRHRKEVNISRRQNVLLEPVLLLSDTYNISTSKVPTKVMFYLVPLFLSKQMTLIQTTHSLRQRTNSALRGARPTVLKPLAYTVCSILYRSTRHKLSTSCETAEGFSRCMSNTFLLS
jgi:hypothetical protein